MSSAGRYLLSLVCIGIACGIGINCAEGCGNSEKQVKMICGLVLCLVILSPALEYGDIQLNSTGRSIMDQAEALAEEGKQIGDTAIQKCINDTVCAYIVGVAEEAGADLTAEIIYENDSIKNVILNGMATQPQKEEITRKLKKSLSIGDGTIIWNP